MPSPRCNTHMKLDVALAHEPPWAIHTESQAVTPSAGAPALLSVRCRNRLRWLCRRLPCWFPRATAAPGRRRVPSSELVLPVRGGSVREVLSAQPLVKG